MLGAPRACGDDPNVNYANVELEIVLPAHAGMIPLHLVNADGTDGCSPRMRG